MINIDDIINDTLIIIPSRLASVRLPNKPLAMINNKPMIIRVIELVIQSRVANKDNIYVACCGEEIAKIVKNYGFNAIITPSKLPTGTDRVYYASKIIEKKQNKKYKYIINVQGDMVLFDPDIIEKTLYDLKNNKLAKISTPIMNISNDEDLKNPNVVKAIISSINNRGIYFTRNSLPHCANKNIAGNTNTKTKNEINLNEINQNRNNVHQHAYKHIGIYAYKKNALSRFVKLLPSKLELLEQLEQLRALEHNMYISTTFVQEHDVISVDTPLDLQLAQNFISKN